MNILTKDQLIELDSKIDTLVQSGDYQWNDLNWLTAFFMDAYQFTQDVPTVELAVRHVVKNIMLSGLAPCEVVWGFDESVPLLAMIDQFASMAECHYKEMDEMLEGWQY